MRESCCAEAQCRAPVWRRDGRPLWGVASCSWLLACMRFFSDRPLCARQGGTGRVYIEIWGACNHRFGNSRSPPPPQRLGGVGCAPREIGLSPEQEHRAFRCSAVDDPVRTPFQEMRTAEVPREAPGAEA